jgi:hypothetical protein
MPGFSIIFQCNVGVGGQRKWGDFRTGCMSGLGRELVKLVVLGLGLGR